MPVKKEIITSLLVPLACDASAACDEIRILVRRAGEVSDVPNIKPPHIRIAHLLYDRAPVPFFIISQVHGVHRTPKGPELRRLINLLSRRVGPAAKGPCVDHITNGLGLVRKAWTAVNLNVSIIGLGPLLVQVRQKAIEPRSDLASPWDVCVVCLGIEICCESDLSEIAAADEGASLLFDLFKGRHEDGKQQCDDRDDH